MSKDDQTRIVVLGPLRGEGQRILEMIIDYCNAAMEDKSVGIVKLCLASDISSVQNISMYSPEEARRCSVEAIEKASGALVVFLSPVTVKVDPGGCDVTGGPGFEVGVIYQQIKSGREFPVAFLFDGPEWVAKMSSLLRGDWPGQPLEAVTPEAGNVQLLCEYALQLCVSLSSRLRRCQGLA